jgi:small subunit ribosomal protein S8
MVTDPVSDMIIQLKNAQMAGRSLATVSFSNFKLAIAELLKQEGYLKSITKKGKKVKKFLELELANKGTGAKIITDVKRMSKPSRRMYCGAKEVKSVRQGYGMAVYSTPKGVMTDKAARAAKVGGEILFQLY